jgi:hypothetical protein
MLGSARYRSLFSTPNMRAMASGAPKLANADQVLKGAKKNYPSKVVAMSTKNTVQATVTWRV